MSKKILVSALVISALALSGCGLFGKKETSKAQTTSAGTESGSFETSPGPVEIGGSAGTESGAVPEIGKGAQQPDNIIYFDYDSTAINEAGLNAINRFGKYLAANPAAKLRLEGHADERGTREYNVGLGERRADAVKQALVNAGAAPGQLSVISYGEERPADPAHTEVAWAKNRRVEIVKQ